MILLVLLYMLFASTFTIGKAALAYTTPIFFIGLRMLIGGPLLLAYQYFFNPRGWKWKLPDLSLIAQVSFFQYYFSFILEFVGMQYVDSSKACLLFNFAPFITATISYFIFHERLSGMKIAGMSIGFLGLMPVLTAQAPGEAAAGSFAWLSVPEILLITAVCSASYGWIAFKRVLNRGYSPVMINGIAMTLSGCASLITSLILEGTPTVIPPETCISKTMPCLCSLFGPYGAGIALFAAYAVLLIFIANIVCFNLYGYLLDIYSATFVSFGGFVTPLFAAFFGWLFLGEHIGKSFFFSVTLVFFGLLLFFQQELKVRSS